MRLSRISRGLIVALFVCIIIFFGILDLKMIFQNSFGSLFGKAFLIRVMYVTSIFILTIIYVYIKDKLYKIKVKRRVALVYRYIYLISVILFTRYIIVIKTIDAYTNNTLGFNIIFSIIIALIVKRIVFNISKSDILSVIALISTSMIYNVINDKELLVKSYLLSIVMLSIILFMQFLIDELKQKGVKTKKYHVESIIVGIFIGISLLFNISGYMWLIVLFILLLITINMDTTHFNFPKVIVNSVSKNNKDRLYKIEQININKIFVSIITIIVTMLAVYGVMYLVLNNEMLKSTFSIIDINCNMNNIITYTKNFIGLSKSFNLFLIIYILIIEVLSFFLRRRYDTKTTIIKTIFITLYVMCCLKNIEILYFQPLFSIMLIVIAIINTSSLYLNREERVKMLVA